MMILNALFQHTQDFSPNKHIWLAYSGGVDSHVLLHSVVQLRERFPDLQFSAVHIHHGLHPQADEWAKHCEKTCRDLNVDCRVMKVDVKRLKGESLEAVARTVRYNTFKTLMKKDDVLLTAHHQDDQAETCLLQFLRGAGIKGLAAMPEKTKFADGILIRPFLKISRQAILNYANEHQLAWIEDDSNHDLHFTRNFLRYRVIPLLREQWPTVSKTIMRVSDHCANADELLKESADQDLSTVKGSSSLTLSVHQLKALPENRQKNVVREWLTRQGYLLPSAKKLNHLLTDVVYAREDAMPCVSWQGVEIRRYHNELYALFPSVHHDASVIITWDFPSDLELPSHIGILSSKHVVGRGIYNQYLNHIVTVRFRREGERCYLPKCKGSRSLKKLFQEWNIPPWERSRIPLIYIDDQLAVIVGYAICEPFMAREKEEGVDVFLESSNNKGLDKQGLY